MLELESAVRFTWGDMYPSPQLSSPKMACFDYLPALNWLLVWFLALACPLQLELTNSLVFLSSCTVLGRSSPNRSFPGLRFREQACQFKLWVSDKIESHLYVQRRLRVHVNPTRSRSIESEEAKFSACITLSIGRRLLETLDFSSSQAESTGIVCSFSGALPLAAIFFPEWKERKKS